MSDKKPLTMRNYKPKQPKRPTATALPKPFPVRLQVVFMAGGQTIGTVVGEVAVMPPGEGKPVTITLPIDARQLMAALEQQMGPASRASKLWTPDQGRAPVVLAKKD